MTKASDQALKTLHTAASGVYQSCREGADPTAAVIKAARENEFTRQWTGRLMEITNRLLTVDHLENAPATQKTANHRLVDTDRVLSTLFPTTVTKAASRTPAIANTGPYHYRDIPESFVKAASTGGLVDEDAPEVVPPLGGSNPGDVLQRAQMMHMHLKQANDGLRSAEQEAEHRLAALAKTACAAIQKSGLDPAELEERAVAWFGDDAKAAFSIIARYVEKSAFPRFTGTPRAFTTDPWATAPYCHVKEAVIATRQETLTLDTQTKVAAIADRLSTQLLDSLRALASIQAGEKQGFSLGGLLGSGDSKPAVDQTEMMTSGLTPEDVNFMSSLQAREALVGALRDPVISRSNLSDVIRAYNRYSDTTPRSFRNEASLTSILRSALEQPDQAPHDLGQLQQVEKGLAAAADPTNPSNT